MVRDFEGNPEYHERKSFARGESVSGLKLELTFADGEVLAVRRYWGTTQRGRETSSSRRPEEQQHPGLCYFVRRESVRQMFDHLIEETP